MTAADHTLASALGRQPIRARKLAVLTGLSTDTVRDGLRRLQAEGRAVSHDRKWVAA